MRVTGTFFLKKSYIIDELSNRKVLDADEMPTELLKVGKEVKVLPTK